MTPPTVDRRTFLRALAASAGTAALGLTAGGLWVGPRWLEVTHHALGPTGRPPRLTLVQLTDLHLPARLGALEEDVAKAVHAAAPDVVLITGDAIDDAGRLPVLARFLDRLPAAPTYASLDNWEHWAGVDLGALRRVYAEAGVRLLVNETALLERHGLRVLVTGLDDATASTPRPAEALHTIPPGSHHLVLAHSPAYRDVLAERLSTPPLDRHRVTAVLAGHTHGGQVDLLGYKPFLPPGTGPYVEGWFREDGPALYVSRGVGTSVLPVRLGARPELPVFTWHA